MADTKTLTVSVDSFSLTSRYTCTANLDSDGSTISIQTSTPTTVETKKLFAFALPEDATNISAVLSATISDPLYSSRILTINGTTVSENGTRTLSIPVTATTRYVQIPFKYSCRAYAHDTHSTITYQHTSTVTFSNVKLTITYTSDSLGETMLEKHGTTKTTYTDSDNQIWLKGTGSAGQVWNFNVSNVPEGAIVTKATLSFTSGNTYNNAGAVRIFWGTSTSGTRIFYCTGSVEGESRTVDLTSYIPGNGSYSLYFNKTANSSSSQSNIYFTSIKVTVEYTYYVDAPKPPTTVTINNGSSAYVVENGTATLAWSGANSGASNITISSYSIYVNGQLYSTQGASVSSISIPAYTGGAYSWTIGITTSENDTSVQSNPVYCYTYNAPGAPTSITVQRANAEPGGTTILGWSGATDGFYNEVIKYHIYTATSTTGTKTFLGETAETTYEITAPTTKNATNYYWVYSIGKQGLNSPISATYAAFKCYYTAPKAPSGKTLYSAVPSEEVTITWDAAVAGENNPVVGYNIYKNGALLAENITNRSYTVNAADEESIKDSYQIYTIGTYENDVTSLTVFVTTLALPYAVEEIFVDKFVAAQGDTIPIWWNPAPENPKAPKTGYQVLIQTSNDGATWSNEANYTTTNLCTLAIPADNPGVYKRFKIIVLGQNEGQESPEKISKPFYIFDGNFTDNELIVSTTPIKAVHMTEIQDLVNIARDNAALARKTFSEIISGVTSLGEWTEHVTEIREAIDEFNSIHEDWIEIPVNKPTVAVMQQLRDVILYKKQKTLTLDASYLDEAVLGG